MEAIAKLIEILPEQSGVGRASNKPWKRRSFIFETQESYPTKMCVDFMNERADNVNAQIGDIVKVSFDIDSHEFNGKWYTSLRGWRVEAANVATNGGYSQGGYPPQPGAYPPQPGAYQQPVQPNYGAPQQQGPAVPPPPMVSGGAEEDLPF